tara:strand:+ start:252 stop:980 length:729 start_codon:yes stop_codon:yes gene_type:complete
MSSWRQQGNVWQLRPNQPQALVEFIGGSYLAATPQVSYRRLLEDLARLGIAVHAWAYVPGFDHQAQARQAWTELREARLRLIERTGSLPAPLRLGHSLGCKLQLLAPDGGRGSQSLMALSFNNFAADRSIPLLGELAPRLGVETEFSPSPRETLRLIRRHYLQPRNLVVRFGRDDLDQSDDLLEALQQRSEDASDLLQLPGDHLTPASAGLRRSVLGDWADDPKRVAVMQRLTTTIRDQALG